MRNDTDSHSYVVSEILRETTTLLFGTHSEVNYTGISHGRIWCEKNTVPRLPSVQQCLKVGSAIFTGSVTLTGSTILIQWKYVTKGQQALAYAALCTHILQ